MVAYLDTLDVEVESRKKIDKYLDFVRRRANGTCNTWQSLAYNALNNKQES